MADEDSVESDGQFLARVGTDAQVWANEFLGRLGPSIAEDTSPGTDLNHIVMGWFANAIGAGESKVHGQYLDRWKWLESTRELQAKYFNVNYDVLKFQHLADYLTVQSLSLHCEITEFLDEVNWKPWMVDRRGEVPDRDAAVGELIDAAHFLANLACALDVTDAEWEEKYQAKQERNRRRQESGSYTKYNYKCSDCSRELDRPGAITCTSDGTYICFYCMTPVKITHYCAHCGLIEPKRTVVDGIGHCDNCGHAILV